MTSLCCTLQIINVAPDILMVAVFDGHAGDVASTYVCNSLVNHIQFWLERGETKLTNVLHKSFIDVNNAFTKYLYHNHIGKMFPSHSLKINQGKINMKQCINVCKLGS